MFGIRNVRDMQFMPVEEWQLLAYTTSIHRLFASFSRLYPETEIFTFYFTKFSFRISSYDGVDYLKTGIRCKKKTFSCVRTILYSLYLSCLYFRILTLPTLSLIYPFVCCPSWYLSVLSLIKSISKFV